MRGRARRGGVLGPALAIATVAATATGALLVPMLLGGRDGGAISSGVAGTRVGAGGRAAAGAAAAGGTYAGATVAAFPVTPNDEFVADQWGLAKVSAPQAWQLPGATGRGTVVAVIDSGVDLQHPDLDCPGKLLVVANSDVISNDDNPDDEFMHGTHVAGIIGACTNNGVGTAGVVPEATILPIRSLDANGSTGNRGLATVADGIVLATQRGAHVINLSLSAAISPGIPVFLPGILADLDDAIDYAVGNGVVVVASAGNDALPLCEYPALVEKIICVGATDPRDLKASYSNWAFRIGGGNAAALVAPGGTNTPLLCGQPSENVLSLVPVDHDPCDEGRAEYADFAGTSMAAPHVAGVAALVYGRIGAARSLTNAQTVTKAIVDHVDDLGLPGTDPVYGSGRVNALAAVQSVPYAPVATPGPSSSTFSFTASTLPPPENPPAGGEVAERTAIARSLDKLKGAPAPMHTADEPVPVVQTPPARRAQAASTGGGWSALSYALAMCGAAVLAWSRFT